MLREDLQNALKEAMKHLQLQILCNGMIPDMLHDI